VSGTTVRPAAASSSRAVAAARRLRVTGVGAVIAAAVLLALALRCYQLAQPGHLLGVGDYDDGADFGSALALIHGVLPYRDFIIVQPPGITLLMTPAALLSPLAGTAWAIAAARILTVVASAACVLLGGLLVRHRGVFATVVTCGFIAIYPGSVQAAHTVLLEPWLTAFCLAGALAAFDRDRLASGSRLAWGGAALGFAGAVKVWAIIPAAVIAVACLPRTRQLARFAGGVAAGFLIPVLPFAALDPGRFYDSVIVAQLTRAGARTPLAFRLQYLTGLAGWQPPAAVLWTAAAVIGAAVAGAPVAAWLATRRAPSPLEWFAVATTVVVIIAFLIPDDFYYHYSAFLAPFLAMAFALPAARLIDAGHDAATGQRRDGRRPVPPAGLRRPAVAVAGLAILVLPLALPGAEDSPTPTYATAVAAVERAVPPGACVLSDQASVLISADRFVAGAAGCPVIVDGTGTGYALGGGRSAPQAGAVPAVEQLWLRAFESARYVLLTPDNRSRIAWTEALEAYFAAHFTRLTGDWAPLALYARTPA
jgi:alpha-1,2-mannosyltransferase